MTQCATRPEQDRRLSGLLKWNGKPRSRKMRRAVPLVRDQQCGAFATFRVKIRRVPRLGVPKLSRNSESQSTLVECPLLVRATTPVARYFWTRNGNKRHVNIVGVSFPKTLLARFSPFSLSLFSLSLITRTGAYLRFSRFRERDRQSKFVNAESYTLAVRSAYTRASENKNIQKMSVVPLAFHDWWDEFDRPVSRLMDQHFGKGLYRDDLISRVSDLSLDRPLRSIFRDRYYRRPWRNVTQHHSSGSSTVQIDSKDDFQVILDVQQFLPEEITVKTVGNNNIIVEAKHEERQDEHGFVSRHFVRRYVLPSSHDVINITSSLSSDGVLTITAPKKGEAPSGGERIIEIVKTGTPASKPVKIETAEENEEK